VVDGYGTDDYAVETEVPQGSLLSPILYIFYNSNLIEECDSSKDTAATGYIDDAAILAWGPRKFKEVQTSPLTRESAFFVLTFILA